MNASSKRSTLQTLTDAIANLFWVGEHEDVQDSIAREERVKRLRARVKAGFSLDAENLRKDFDAAAAKVGHGDLVLEDHVN